ncbi:MAG: hypothetical protein MK008_09840 [Bdellovibrionales bacterium]|nr:hypothetical protein [Bdellovibrionales bacterium]
MRLIFSFVIFLFSIQVYSQDLGTREGNLEYARDIRNSNITDKICQQNDPSGQRIYAFQDAAAVIRCATRQDIQKASDCSSNRKYNTPIWIGSASSPMIRCAYVDPNTFDYYFNAYEDTPENNCPYGKNDDGSCKKKQQITECENGSGRSGNCDDGQLILCDNGERVANESQCPKFCASMNKYVRPGGHCPKNGGGSEPGLQPYKCNVAGRVLPIDYQKGQEQTAIDRCDSIKTAYKTATETAGHQTAMGIDITTLSEPIKTCETLRQNAQTCCGDPYSCIGGEPGGNQAMSVLGNILQGGNKLIAGGTASITSACNTLKNLGRSATAINAAMSQKCNQHATQCQETCKEYQKPLNEMNDYFSNQNVCNLKNAVNDEQLSLLLNESASIYKKNCQYKQRVSRLKEDLTASLVSCNSSKQQVAVILKDAVGTQSIAEFANKCEDISSNQNQFAQDSSSPFNGDCTNPAHSSNPICVQCRLDPSAQQCAGINLGGNPTQASNANSGLVEEESDEDDLMAFNSLGTSGASDENPGLGEKQAIAPNGNQGLASSGAGGSSGGGLGQDNIQALGSDPAGQGGAAGSGYDTNILGNASGGGGYTTSSMGYGNSGGYSGGRITTDIYENTPPTGIVRDGFDLKEYLPGGKAFKGKSRLPAGYIQLPDGEVIGPKHGNIFQMMHERYAYYESLGKFWPPHYSKEKIECIKKSGIMNNPPYANQWTGDNLHKPTPIPNPPQCRHFADHDPNKPDPTQIYLKAEAKKEMTSRTPQSLVASYKNKSLHEIYHTLTKRKESLTKAQYNALYRLYKTKYAEYNKQQGK